MGGVHQAGGKKTAHGDYEDVGDVQGGSVRFRKTYGNWLPTVGGMWGQSWWNTLYQRKKRGNGAGKRNKILWGEKNPKGKEVFLNTCGKKPREIMEKNARANRGEDTKLIPVVRKVHAPKGGYLRVWGG